jgi:hypothetical protein
MAYDAFVTATGQNLPFRPLVGNVRNGPGSGHRTGGVECLF